MKKYVKGILIGCFWILIWQISAVVVGSKLLLPSPVDTLIGLFSLLGDTDFYMDVLVTVGRCLAAIAIALVTGLLLSLLSYRFKIVREILSLPVSFFKAVPVMAIAIYFLLLLSSGEVPVIVCWVMCFPIVYTNLLTGLDSLDDKLAEMANVYEISGSMSIKNILIPSLYPYFKSAMSIISGMSWKAIVTAEVLSVPGFSLGYELMNSKYYLNTDMLFAYVVVIIIISLVFEKILNNMVNRMNAHAYSKSKIINNGFEKPDNTDTIKASECAVISNKISGPMVVMNNVSKSFGDKEVIRNFSMTLKGSETTALIGNSGSGKTTIARMLYGSETADKGVVSLSEPTKIAVLFQEDRLLPWLNAFDNLAIIIKDEKEINDYLSKVGLKQDYNKLPSELSGGMSRRLAIARALAYAEKSKAGVFIADEPFRGLDEATKNRVISDLWKPKTEGRTVLLITHSEEEVEELSQAVIELNSKIEKI